MDLKIVGFCPDVSAGFAFVIQNQGADALGRYEAAIKDPNGNHISVQTRGRQPNLAIHDDPSRINSSIPNLSDGNQHTATIDYRNGTITVAIDDEPPSLTVRNIDLAALLALTDGRAWVGFTAGTGAAYENHDILSWTFEVLD